MNKNKENKNKEKIYLEQTCKLLTFIFAILVIVLGFVILKDYIDKNKVEGKVVSLSELNAVDKEVVNIKNYVKDSSSKIEDFSGDGSGGSISGDNGMYLNYSNHPNNTVLVQIYNDDNSLIFKTTIKHNSDEDISINSFIIAEDNQVILAVNYINESDKTDCKVLKYNKKGEILSELKYEFKDYTNILFVDKFNNITLITIDEDYNNSIIKFNDKNEKIFEYNLGKGLTRCFLSEDKIIAFKLPINPKKNDNKPNMIIINEKGEKIFEKENPNLSLNSMANIVQLSDGSFLLEESQYVNQKDFYGYKLNSIVKVDSEFNEIWRKEINKIVYDSSILELNNEYILYMKEVYNVKEENTQAKITSVTKFNSLGDSMWCKYLGYDKNKKIDILNNNEIDVNVPIYIQNEQIRLKATIYNNEGASEGNINISIDGNGNIS